MYDLAYFDLKSTLCNKNLQFSHLYLIQLFSAESTMKKIYYFVFFCLWNYEKKKKKVRYFGKTEKFSVLPASPKPKSQILSHGHSSPCDLYTMTLVQYRAAKAKVTLLSRGWHKGHLWFLQWGWESTTVVDHNGLWFHWLFTLAFSIHICPLCSTAAFSALLPSHEFSSLEF